MQNSVVAMWRDLVHVQSRQGQNRPSVFASASPQLAFKGNAVYVRRRAIRGAEILLTLFARPRNQVGTDRNVLE